MDKHIKPINTDTVHKICSGQVVLNLAIAVKELVENSLDAGATCIEVRLKNYGIDLIEVSDNGSGVTEDNFTALTMKYHTSKLSEYTDLLGVSSFGFRGEALSSLCALANLTVTTKHETSNYASKIEYDYKGCITKKALCARQNGTTITLSNLFASLPVRQKEFHRNAKKEFNKMTQMLYAYCLISLGVKITCTNQTNSNAKSVVVATSGSHSYKDNIASVFGSKQLDTLLDLIPEYVPNIKENIMKGLLSETEEANVSEDVAVDDIEIDLSEESNDAEGEQMSQEACSQKSSKSQGYINVVRPVEFTGLISSCAHGSGRSSADRQFYFVNSRPCEPPKVMKLINEVYRQYNPNQYPFIFLNITMDRASVDINVTPDKRKVFLTKEKIILDVLKSSMLKLFESIPRTFKMEPLSKFSVKDINEEHKADVDQPRIFGSFLKRFANNATSADKSRNDGDEKKVDKTELKRKSTTMLDFISAKSLKSENSNTEIHNQDNFESNEESSFKVEFPDVKEEDKIQVEYEKRQSPESPNKTFSSSPENSLEDHPTTSKNSNIILLGCGDLPNTQIRQIDEIVEKSHKIVCKSKDIQRIANIKEKKTITDKEDLGVISERKTVHMKTSLEHVKALMELSSQQKSKQKPDRVKFRNGINPVFNKKCEEELNREISKESFKQMEIIGQFNLGFIITRLEDDLFVIDQHATDEIYNFETLQRNTELTSQKLVIPQQLELTGVNEQILMDNLDVFKKNGFTFDIDKDAPPTTRVKLLTIPMSKNWLFGKEDIEELLFMLRECGPEARSGRPSRVRAMFASRACRRSVMVGAALAAADMRRLVDHMAELDRPWNCPHGRPTIRHLVNLAMVHTTD